MADEFGFPVDLSSILLFAGALDETNPIYYDEEHARRTPLGGVIAPPTWRARKPAGFPSDSSSTALGSTR